MAELLAAAAAQNPGLPVLRAALARLYCDLGRDAEAVDLIQEDIADGFAQFPQDPTWLSGMATLCELCTHLGRSDGAALLYERLSPWHAQVSTVMVTTQGPVAFHLGTLSKLLGRRDQAMGHFSEALEVARRLDSPYFIARTEIALADLLREATPGDARGDEMLASALASARRFGFGGLLERGRDLA
jgi:tetratricopeptide (TPR) repeat protein